MNKDYTIVPRGCSIRKTQEKEASLESVYRLRRKVSSYLGEKALYFRAERHGMVPILVDIYEVYFYHVIVRRKCYDPYGNFRQYSYESIAWGTLFCGEEELRFFDRDI